MGRKAREIKRLGERVFELENRLGLTNGENIEARAQRDAAVRRAEGAEAKLKAVRKALGMLEPSGGISIQPSGFVATASTTNPSVIWSNVRHIPPAV